MASQAFLLFAYSSLFILLRCVANAKPNCIPSACGIISNISYPFRLKGDPSYCGDRRFELACENNVTFLYLNSHKYYVKAISYINQTIRVVDASINNHTCSFPTSSAYLYNFTTSTFGISYIYRVHISTSPPPYDPASSLPINMMSCPHPLKNSSNFTNITHCQTSNSRFTYIKLGLMKASDVPERCRVDVIVLTSWGFKDFNNSVSLEEIHSSLLYGFELDFCAECRTSTTAWEIFTDYYDIKLRSEESDSQSQ